MKSSLAPRRILASLCDAQKPKQVFCLQALRTAVATKNALLLQCIHCNAVKNGIGQFQAVANSVLYSYGRIGSIIDTRSMFDELPIKNFVAETMMVSVYMWAGMVGNAIVVFEQMNKRDVPAWNAVIVGCIQNGFHAEGMRLFIRMICEGVLANCTTVSSVLSACGHLGMLHAGKSVHGYAYRIHVWFGESVVNALLDMYGRCGHFSRAKWIFENLSGRRLITWNSMINCLSLHGHNEDAIKMFDQMILENVDPDEITFVGVLNACAHGGFVGVGLVAFQSMRIKFKIEPQAEHYGCVVDLLGRAGHLNKAMEFILNTHFQPDKVAWGSLINSCRIHGKKEIAEFVERNFLKLESNSVDWNRVHCNRL